MRIALAQLNQTVGDLDGNVARIIAACQQAARQRADIVLLPEYALTGAPAQDLLLREEFHACCHEALARLREQTATLALTLIVGMPILGDDGCSSAALVLHEGRELGRSGRQTLDRDTGSDDCRYLVAGGGPLLVDIGGHRCAVALAADASQAEQCASARAAGTVIFFVLGADPWCRGRKDARREAIGQAAAGMSVAFANLVGGQDEVVYDGSSFVLDSRSRVLAQARSFDEDLLCVEFSDVESGILARPARIEPALELEEQVYRALVTSLRDYVEKNGIRSVLLGLSGGIDSALVLAIAVDALGAQRVWAIMMPSEYTAEISLADAREMANGLGVRYDELAVGPAFGALRETLAGLFAGLPWDTTEENLQARVRGNLLMALSNKFGAIVLTTSNKSESAVGYSTLYGDMAGGFALLKDVSKTLVYRLARWRNRDATVIPERIISRAPSAELRAEQTDQDSLPPYDQLDGIMELFVEEQRSAAQIIAAGYPVEVVERVLGMIRRSEYKRRQAPVGPRVTPRAFGADWRQPMTSRFTG